MFSSKKLISCSDKNDLLQGEIQKLLALFLPHFNDTPLHTPSSLLPDSHLILPLTISAYAKKIKEMESIIKVDNRFKMINDFQPGSQSVSTIQINIDKYNALLKNINFANLYNQTNDATNTNSFLISLKFKNLNKFYFYVKEDKENIIENCLNRIIDILPPIHIERKSRKHIRKFLRPLEMSYWGKKETEKEWDQYKSAHRYYKYIAHPLITELFEKHVVTMQSQENHLFILDVGGGKAKLASKLIQLSQSLSIPIHYFLLEPDPYQAEIAADVFSRLETKFKNKALFSTEVICSDLKDFYLKNKKLKNKLHCIISSGGPLSEQVTSYQQAKDHVLIMRDLLIPGGKIIALGFTQLLISKKKFIHSKLTVLNTIKKLDDSGYHGIVQAYVCEKPNGNTTNHFFKQSKSPKEPDEAKYLGCQLM